MLATRPSTADEKGKVALVAILGRPHVRLAVSLVALAAVPIPTA